MEATKTIRQMIVDDYTVSDMIIHADDIVNRIKDKQTSLMTAEKILADFQNNGIKTLKEEASRIESEVAFEVNMDKETFKNEAQRKAGITDALNKSADYQKVLADIKRAEVKMSELQQGVTLAKIEVEHARNMFSVWKCQADMIAGLSHENSQKVTFNHIMELKHD